MAEPEYVPMSPENRDFLERRAVAEASSGRLLLGLHVVLLAAMLAIARSDPWPKARGPLLVAAVVGVSGAAWFVYIRFLAARIAADLGAARIAVARVRLVRKSLAQRKASVAHYLHLDPPLPEKKALVGASIYDAVAEGDRLTVRYFPVSRIIFRVEKL
jgi:hypothetical protein